MTIPQVEQITYRTEKLKALKGKILSSSAIILLGIVNIIVLIFVPLSFALMISMLVIGLLINSIPLIILINRYANNKKEIDKLTPEDKKIENITSIENSQTNNFNAVNQKVL